MPSIFTDLYMKNVHSKVERLYRGIGLVTAPVFMQGFIDGDTVRFYDPGLRLPGGEYERMFTCACGVNPFYPLIEFALTGQTSVGEDYLSKNAIKMNGKFAGQILPALRPGTITTIEGMDKILSHPNVVSAFARYGIGNEIKATKNVNQRFSEIDLVCNSPEELRDTAKWVYDTLWIRDEHGENMIISSFDPEIFYDRGKQLGS